MLDGRARIWWVVLACVCVSSGDGLLESMHGLLHSTAGLTPAVRPPPGGRTSRTRSYARVGTGASVQHNVQVSRTAH